MFENKDGRLIWKHERQTMELQAWGEGVIRVRATINSGFVGAPNALVAEKGTRGVVAIDSKGAGLKSGGLEARVSGYGRVSFFKAGAAEPFLEESDWKPEHAALYPASREFFPLEGELCRIEARFTARDGERFYGLGQHRHGLLDQKGAVIEFAQRNAEIAIPFALSSRGYGFLWNNPAIGRVELGATGTRWVAEASRQLDYLVMTGHGYAGIMESYAEATGRPPAFPEYAAGFWQCKLRYVTQDELLKVAREYKRRELPLSVIVVDYFHWARQGEWQWDPKCWPDPAGMIRELESLGIKLMVSVWPSVNPKTENGKEMKSRGFLIGAKRGVDVNFPFVDTYEERPTYVHYYDSTNPEARAYVWGKVKANYWDKGVRIFWLDACEPEIYPVHHDNLRFFAGAGQEVANIYPMMHEQGFFEGMRAAGQKEVLNLCRSAWAGSQRWGAAVWSGDIMSDWETLRGQVRAGLNMAMSGIPWWTTDIGGFHGGDPRLEDFRELVVRWFQWSLFCPLMRLHGVREPRRMGPGTGADNEVWSFGEEAYGIIREILFLRERLRPYLMAQMKLASDRGIPPMRPLFFDFPQDGECGRIEDEFLFGPEILVAPVLEKGLRGRRVWLPDGAAWTDAWTGKDAQAGRWFEAEAPLARIPVYVRRGAEVGRIFSEK